MHSPRRTLSLLACLFAFGGASIAMAQPSTSNGEPVSVAAVGATTEIVFLEAFLSPGKSPGDNMPLRIKLMVPNTKRVCIAYTGFETVGIKRRTAKSSGREMGEHRCMDAPHTGIVSNEVILQRRDIKGFLNWELDAVEKAVRGGPAVNYQNGYVTVMVTLDGVPHIFKLTSPRFGLATGPDDNKD